VTEWDWDLVKGDFAHDGALRDIYVLNTSAADWQRMIELVRDYAPEFAIGGQSADFPAEMRSLWQDKTAETSFMRFKISGIMFHCFFYQEEEIEFDIEPREVASAEHLEALLGFLRRLGDVLGKTVILTSENGCRQTPIFHYEPATRLLRWVPPPPDRHR